jgi:hypothetical protein
LRHVRDPCDLHGSRIPGQIDRPFLAQFRPSQRSLMSLDVERLWR